MELGLELEPRVKLLPFKIKAMSRESPPQKAAHLLDPDLRTHWSTGTNTKEWILLELEEACLLSQIRIYNKSVLEWEITAGLRYKPEGFVKVRPRCESPRREVIYPMNYTPCRYVRISCLRGNPISVFFVQLFGVSVSGLEPEFQPVVNYLLPHILSHKHEAHDIHLQLLQDMTNRLVGFLPQLELELANFIEDAESNIRFLAMLAGPFCPILRLVNERETKKPVVNTSDLDAFRYSQSSSITVSSNFEAQPRRSRSPSSFNQPSSSFIVFRPDAVTILLRKAYKDSKFGNVCRLASRIIQKLVEPLTSFEESLPVSNLAASAVTDEFSKAEPTGHLHLTDYSCLFGEEFKVPDDQWDTFNLNVLDIAAVEEGILHVLYACASQPHLCCKLADAHSAFSSILPLIQALLPALRPPISNLSERMDDTLWQWKHPSVQQALSQIVVMASSPTYLPLLRVCAGYLSSFITSHVKAACVLIDLCSGPLSPWMLTVIAKVDLAVELVEDLLGVIQGARQSIPRARAALKYVLLALSGHMDDVLVKYKEFKHNLLFLLEMLEPFLDPALDVSKNTIAFGDISAVFIEKQERTCAIALAIIRSALLRPAVLPSLESQWKHGSVAPSVLLSVLGSHMPLPPEIDLCRFSVSENGDQESSLLSSLPTLTFGGSVKSTKLDEFDGKNEVSEATTNIDVHEDAAQFFAPQELRRTLLTNLTNNFLGSDPDKFNEESKHGNREKFANDQFQNALSLDNGFSIEYINLQADYLQLANFHDCEYRASEFQRLAMEISSQYDVNPEGHDAVIDALLLAAECYANPFFMLSFRPTSTFINHMKTITAKVSQNNDAIELKNDLWKKNIDMEKIAQLEGKRDKTILYLLLHAAKLDQEYLRNTSPEEVYLCDQKSNKQNVSIDISPLDIESVDAVTLVRQNQIMLCHFLMKKLKKEQHSSHEVLLQSLLFFLCSATELSCHPEDVIDVLIHSTVNLNALITSFYNQFREGKVPLDQEKLHGVQRRWVLLRHLIIASSGSCEGTDFISRTRKGFHYRSLIPHSSWIQEISNFSNCSFPLARFLGWMAVSRYAQHYLKERLFLASDLSQLTSLLSIFVDELSCVGNKTDWKSEASKTPEFEMKQGSQVGNQSDPSDTQDSFCVLYPDMHKFFPSMRKQFRMFGETILEAVGLQLKCLPHSAVPEALCWFSDLCLSPYPEADKDNFFLNSADHLRGHVATNVKSVLLYILESIVTEHMEYMLPEMPRVAQILISLCKTSYCDVAFLNSILCLLRPLISYFLRKATYDEKLLEDVGSEFDFELVSFEELFECLRCRKEIQGYPGEREIQGSRIIFILGSLFPDLSFRRKSEILRSLLLWVDFATSEPTSSFYSYLYAFQKVIDNCNILLAENIKSFGIHIPSEKNQLYEGNSSPDLDGSLPCPSGFHDTSCQSTFTKSNEEGRNHPTAAPLDQGVQRLSSDEIIEFSKDLELLISKLLQSIEFCWNLHCRLAMKLTYTLAKCFMFSRCLGSINQAVEVDSNDDGGGACPSELSDLSFKHWRIALEGLIKLIVTIQQDRCWQVASAMLDYLLGLPPTLPLDCVFCTLCTAIKNFCCHAPRISWRLQSDKWLSSLIKTGLGSVHEDDSSVADLFCTMLGHSEPEQRAVALQHLGRIVGLGMDDGVAKLSYTLHASLIESDSDISIAESVISVLVSSTWDIIANLALSDPSLLLQRHAMALLSGYIPFAKRSQLQSFLVSTNTILQGLGRFSHSMEGIQSIQLSLSLLASACLYSPTEDIALIPESVWKNLESMGKSGKGALDSKEKSLCLALCKLRNEPVDVKVLNEVLSSSPAAKPSDPNFQSTRESILEVISSLTSIQSYFDFFSGKVDQELQELEEAEIEMELLQKEKAMKEVAERSQQEVPPSYEIMDDLKYNNRIQKIKEDIRTLEKLRIREELIAHREKKLLKWRARQSYLEEVASREMELLQGLDRERTSQFQCEIERQRLLELERAKTKELQHNLEMERERQTQRELQQELEQVEAGIRPTRREFSLNTTRPKERYRERESGRSGQEGSLRPGSRGREGGGVQAATSGSSMTSPGPTVMLAGSRSFSGQFPNILQARDLPDERSSVYEDTLDGSRDSGDTNSIGDPELATAFDSLGGGFVSATRQGSRGSKSRQVTERRERDGRREGKWERKHL